MKRNLLTRSTCITPVTMATSSTRSMEESNVASSSPSPTTSSPQILSHCKNLLKHFITQKKTSCQCLVDTMERETRMEGEGRGNRKKQEYGRRRGREEMGKEEEEITRDKRTPTKMKWPQLERTFTSFLRALNKTCPRDPLLKNYAYRLRPSPTEVQRQLINERSKRSWPVSTWGFANVK